MDLLDFGLYAGYIALFVAVAGAVALPLVSAVKNPASLLRSLIGVGALVVIFVIAYAVSSSELTTAAMAKGINESGTKMIGAGLITFYLLLAASILGLVYSEVSKTIK